MRRGLFTLFFCSFACISFAQIDQSLSYDELQSKAIDLVGKTNIDSAIIVMEYAVKKFPEENQWSTALLAQLYSRAGKKTEAVAIWKAGMGKGYNYHLTNPAYDKYYKDDGDFMKLLSIEKARLDTSHIQYGVILPINYTPNNRYPVLFIFHGNNRNIKKSKVSWASQTMKDEYISVFLQSYIYSNEINYVWKSDDTKTEKEFKDIYDKILSGYSVDTTKIILAGMSAGGMLALEFAFNEFVPISGLVLNCPVVPDGIGDELTRQFIAKNRGIGIITGEKDFALEGQKSLISGIKEQGGRSRITISKDAGHEFVQDFSSLLDEYLKWIIEKENRNDEIPVLKGDYLGQVPPGNVPEVFAPGIVSVDSTIEHGAPTFSPDGNIILWQSNLRHKDKETEIFLNIMRRTEGRWTAPEISPFGGMPAFSSDGMQLFFLPFDTEKEKGLNMIVKKGENWSEPKSINLIARYPELKYLYGPSVTNSGTLYFFAYAEGLGSLNDFGIYRSELINGEYAKPELLPPCVNAGDGVLNWTPFIAPDESYLLFSSNRFTPDTDFGDIYVCFRRADGSWTEAINLGTSINSGRQERFPSLSPDGKYLFFTRWIYPGNEDVMWVSSEIINELRQDAIN